MNQSSILCVDLDGTLLRTDILFESFVKLIKQNPFYAFSCFYWLALKGKSGLKSEIAKRVNLNIELLPYNTQLIEWINSNRSKYSKVILATATNEKYAKQIAMHLKLFDEVVSSSKKLNLSSSKKASLLTEKYGEPGFEYIGNSRADIPVWKVSQKCHVVGSKKIHSLAKKSGTVESFHPASTFSLKSFIKQIRVHQWAKNLLIFVPMILSHNLTIEALTSSIIAFISFSLCASSVYVLNDILDLDADRVHRTKKNRPLASGKLSLAFAIILTPVLMTLSFTLGSTLGLNYLLILGSYFVLTTLYSFYLKRLIIWDVLILSILFTVRIFSGSMATNITISNWLFMFSIFFFLGLAILKRFIEVFPKAKSAGNPLEYFSIEGRGYVSSDFLVLGMLGISSSFISVFVFIFYLKSEQVSSLYNQPLILYPISLLLLFWNTRIWTLSFREKVNDDPVLFAIKDKTSYFIGACIVILLVLATIRL